MNSLHHRARFLELEPRIAPAINFLFDYRFDDNDFFNDHIDRVNLLNAAAREVGALFTDTLTAIPAPTAGNSWKGIFTHPSRLTEETAENLVVPANTVVVFVGSRDLGFATSVEISSEREVAGTTDWQNLVLQRGQVNAIGPNATDYGPWGGSISFDRFEDWHFGIDPPGNENEIDFYTVAQNSLLQMLGFGNSDVWEFRTATGGFVGPNVTVSSGLDAIPLNGDRDAWADGTLSKGLPTLMDETINDGERVAISDLDLAGMRDLGWTTTDSPTSPLPPPPPPVGVRPPVIPPVVIPPGYRFQATGAGSGATSEFTFNEASTFTEVARIAPYGTTFSGGVRTATGDVNGDQVEDVIVGPGLGTSTFVNIYNGTSVSINPAGSVLKSILAFETSFTAGVYVSVGDVNGDGVGDIAISPDEGGGPRVRLFSGNTFEQINDFFGIDDPNFRGGARTAIGDLNGDGFGDLIVAAGFGGGPRVAAYDGKSLATTPVKLFPDFFIFEDTLRNGAFVAVGDLNGDGRDDLIAGGGPGGGPRVFALSGSDLTATTTLRTQLANFFAGDPNGRGGVRVATENLDSDLTDDLITGLGDGSPPLVTTYLSRDLTPNNTPATFQQFQPFDSTVTGGVFVG